MRGSQGRRSSAAGHCSLCGYRELRRGSDHFARRDIHVSKTSRGRGRDVLRRSYERGLKSGSKVRSVGSDVRRRRGDRILQAQGTSALLCVSCILRRSHYGILQLRCHAGYLGSGRERRGRNHQSRLLGRVGPGDHVGHRDIRFQFDLGRSDDGLRAIVGFAWNRDDGLRREFRVGLAGTII